MKKAQTEILGIALVVVVLVFAGLIYLSFSLNKPKQVSSRRLMQVDIIKNYYITSMLESTTTCNNLQFKTLLNKYLSGDYSYSCNSEPLESYILDQIPEMLNFLNESGLCYQFVISPNVQGVQPIIYPKKVSCDYTQSTSTHQNFIYDYGTADISLTIFSK